MAIDRVMGIETEYGISRRSAEKKSIYDERDQNHISDTDFVIGSYDSALAKWDYNAEQELPLGDARHINNRILTNGARFYDDHGHPEYSTPECTSPLQLVIHDKAGERILNHARMLANAYLQNDRRTAKDSIVIYKNNFDSRGKSFGCHENYLIERRTPWNKIRELMIPFFVTRQIFTGAGKVGLHTDSYPERRLYHPYQELKRWILSEFQQAGVFFEIVGLSGEHNDMYGNLYSIFHNLEKKAKEESLEDILEDSRSAYYHVLEFLEKGRKDIPAIYQLSQRADFFVCEEGQQTTAKRPLINLRDEPHADPSKYRRFHVIVGDSNLAPWSTYLKTGTTKLVLDLIEDGLIGEEVVIQNPVDAFHSISRDQEWKWNVTFLDGSQGTAIDVQELYLNKAKQHYSSDPASDEIIGRWEYVLDALKRQDFPDLSTKLDHAIKKQMLDGMMKKHNWSLASPEVLKLDMRYHNIDPDEGIFHKYQSRGRVDTLGISEDDIKYAMTNPPEDTRAYFRGECLRRFPHHVISSNWDVVNVRNGRHRDEIKLEPFRGTKKLTQDIFDNAGTISDLVDKLEVTA
ncbi:MAG: proteasome accessory factor PafA2 family protein [Candidatus Aenigmarchaeota archaeon]|nr:proteasome accessory factor PafA2 family protein [Candidatus Aenigmarchaeota archaeon]